MKTFSEKFVELVKQAVESYRLKYKFIEILGVELKHDYIFIRTSVLDKEGFTVGYGIGLYPNEDPDKKDTDFCLFHEAPLLDVKAEDVWADIKHLFGNVVSLKNNHQLTLDSIFDKHQEIQALKEELEYTKALLIVEKYENKDSELPF